MKPSKITVGPPGSWPLRFDKLVQPVLDAKCIKCHSPKSKNAKAAKFDLTAAKAYGSLCNYGKPNLNALVHRDYRSRNGASVVGGCAAAGSAVLAMLTAAKAHQNAKLSKDDLERLITWMDVSPPCVCVRSATADVDAWRGGSNGGWIISPKNSKKIFRGQPGASGCETNTSVYPAQTPGNAANRR